MENNQNNTIAGLDTDRLKKISVNRFGDDSFESLQKCGIMIRVAHCARISYNNFEGKDDYEADIDLCDKLFGSIPRHLSPTEHVAQAMDESKFIGNFKGFKQYRKFFEGENATDTRVKKYDCSTANKKI